MTSYTIPAHSLWLHDQDDSLAALVASGDCFVTLATQLDELGPYLYNTPGHEPLEAVVKVLMDLQRHYKIVSKPHDYRQ